MEQNADSLLQQQMAITGYMLQYPWVPQQRPRPQLMRSREASKGYGNMHDAHVLLAAKIDRTGEKPKCD
jgi:hypothetical protein